jgi:hypothetical protein
MTQPYEIMSRKMKGKCRCGTSAPWPCCHCGKRVCPKCCSIHSTMLAYCVDCAQNISKAIPEARDNG